MANKLVIVESPAKAKTIGKFWAAATRSRPLRATFGIMPKSQIGVDAENGFEPKYITIRGRGEILSRIRKEARSASQDLSRDRPGPRRRGHFLASGQRAGHRRDAAPAASNSTKSPPRPSKAAVKVPRPIDMNLVDAQQARRVLDRLVGYKISPLLVAEGARRACRAGRVQSVATKMICDRENEIEIFVPGGVLDHRREVQAGAPGRSPPGFTGRMATRRP